MLANTQHALFICQHQHVCPDLVRITEWLCAPHLPRTILPPFTDHGRDPRRPAVPDANWLQVYPDGQRYRARRHGGLCLQPGRAWRQGRCVTHLARCPQFLAGRRCCDAGCWSLCAMCSTDRAVQHGCYIQDPGSGCVFWPNCKGKEGNSCSQAPCHGINGGARVGNQAPCRLTDATLLPWSAPV